MDIKNSLPTVLYVLSGALHLKYANPEPGTPTAWLRLGPTQRLRAKERDQEAGSCATR